eukprot:TRINITY_DN10710_c0_g2_i3.p1 TRINITY_DN10710_c0_g2~~TRINITY_DN10710_c0_g2_i3.p1  ORF type:complete len:133 (-),score=5.16 TRINITY_DN10710_c0_g2_i3:38-436(-)
MCRALHCIKKVSAQVLYTIENIALAVKKKELSDYGIFEKVRFMVTDNASNMTGAAKVLQLKSTPCVVHSIQLIVMHFFKCAKPFIEKTRKIIHFFRYSPKRNLLETQNPGGEALEILSDCLTKWNSKFARLE